MTRYRLEGVKTYKVRLTPARRSEVLIGSEWISFAEIDGLNQLEGNKLLDEHYESMNKSGVSKEFIGNVEEFRQRYNQDKVQYTRDRSNEQDLGI